MDSCLISVVLLVNVPQEQFKGFRNIHFLEIICKCGATGNEIVMSECQYDILLITQF